MIRVPQLLGTVAVCLAVFPDGPPQARTQAAVVAPELLAGDKLPTPEEFAELAKTDPLGLLKASMSRYRKDVRGYTCTLVKRERVNGTLGDEQKILVTFRDDPFAVFMRWDPPPPPFTFPPKPAASLYATGETEGKIVSVGPLGFGKDVLPTDEAARANSRVSILDFGIFRGTLRTYQAWEEAAKDGRLNVVREETKPIPRLNNRRCVVVRRTCDPPEVDRYAMDDPKPKPPAGPSKDAVRYARLFFDADTFLFVGSELRSGDGDGEDTLVASYYFCDVDPQAKLTREQFSKAALNKK